MKKTILLTMLTLMTLTVSAQWRTTGYQQQKTTQKKGEPFVTMGIYHTGDFYKSLGMGLGAMCNIGKTSTPLNLSFGVEYIEYICQDPRPDDKKNSLGVIDGGAQIVFPVWLKLQLFNTSKWTKFYIAGGGELGIPARDGGVAKHYYHDESLFSDHSLAVMPMIGWRARNVDFGFYMKYYLDKPFNHSLNGERDLGEENMRFGYHLTYWF